ncbi:MAG: cell envelope integrity protein TolA [Roseateles sp.]
MSSAVLRPPEAVGMGRGVVLALLAHGLLIAALTYGLNWRSDASPAFEAELWASVPQVAAPREEAPPEPEPQAPRPDPKAQQRAAEEEAAEQREAELAIAKAKKQKEEKARQEREAKAAKEKAEKDKQAREQAAKDKAAKEKAAAQEAKEAKEAEARREALRQQQLRRIQGLAGAAGAPGATGNALQNAAPSAGYAGRIKAKIRPLIIYAEQGAANPTAEVQVTLSPTGLILNAKLLKPSSDPDWDRAVLRAIEKAESLPRDVDGRVPPVIVMNFRPRE